MSFPIDYSTYTSPHTPSWLEYLTTWQQQILHTITNELLKLHTIRQKWLHDGDGIGLSGVILDDILFHCQLTYKKSMYFIGRQNYIDAINNYILAPPREYDGHYSGICAAVIGSSGVGKTSLIANVAVGVYNIGVPTSIPTIVRYCGINKESNDGYSLMKSIASQLLFLYNQSHQISSFPRLFEPAKQCFQDIISSYPAIIFIDALNQLSDLNNARTHLSFLRGAIICLLMPSLILTPYSLEGIKPHDNSRIIVSCIPLNEFYWCEKRLIDGKVPRITLTGFACDTAPDFERKRKWEHDESR